MGRRSRTPSNSGPVEPEDEDFEGYEGDPDVEGLNDPDVMPLSEPPLIGGRTRNAELFGNDAETQGGISSPKLYASSTRFPSAVQFRVWRWENGVPVGLGAIDCEASEDEFVQQFFDAMPRPGDGRFMFKLRPIDIRGHELGQEITQTISEHHSVLQRIRRQRAAAAEDNVSSLRGGGDVHVHGGGGDAASSTAIEEMSRMWERAVDMTDQQTQQLQRQLELERDRARDEEKQRVSERVGLAEKTTEVVQSMTAKLMESDRLRAEEALKSQQNQSSTMMSTLTTVFAQQSQAQREAAERQREIDAQRGLQDREFFERQRQEVESRRLTDREEAERRRKEEQQTFERKQLEAEATRKFELEQYKLRVQEDRDRWRSEIEERRREDERRFEQRRMDEEKKRDDERRAWEQRESLRKEEERRYEERRREEAVREEARRREEIQVQLKQLEVTAQKDREHAERMLEMTRIERESSREAAERREKMEQAAREQADRDRQRQFDMEMRRLEQQAQADREHAERMVALQKSQNSGGMAGLTDMLGMETPELLARIFGAKDGEEGGWSEAIPKTLGALAEVFSTAMKAQPPPQQKPQLPQQQRPQLPPGMPTMPNRFDTRPMTEPGMPAAPPSNFVPSETPAVSKPDEEEEETVPLKKSKSSPDALIKLARESGIKFSDQRKARKGLRTMIEELRKKKEDEYLSFIVACMTSEPTMGIYAKAVSVRAALEEAGATEEEIVLALTTLRDSQMMPADVPLEPADIARIAKEKAEAEKPVEAVVEEKAVEAPAEVAK